MDILLQMFKNKVDNRHLNSIKMMFLQEDRLEEGRISTA